MTFLKALWSDLVDKRLWPVALALLVALVAVPVVLGSGGGDVAPAATPAAGATGATGAGAPDTLRAEVALDPALATRRDRAGKLRDPFTQPPSPKVATATATATTDAQGAGSTAKATAPAAPAADKDAGKGAGAGAGSGAKPDAGSDKTPAPRPSTAQKAARKVDPLHSYRVSLRFGKAGDLERRSDVPRLTPLPSSDNPFFVYLGVLADQKTAVFLVSADVKATGDGTCRPRKTDCQTIEMRAGDTEFFDLVGADGTTTTQYQLDVTRVSRTAARSQVAAARAKSRESKAGRLVLRAQAAASEAPTGFEAYEWSKASGTLQRRASAPVETHLPARPDSTEEATRSTSTALPPFIAGFF